MQPMSLPTDFLLWLDRYLGTWDCDSQRYQVARRPDGWLEARTVDGRGTSLKWLLDNGKRIEPPPSPLGPHPLMIFDEMMQIWLMPDEYKCLRNAWRVGSGMKLIMEAIPRNIRESDLLMDQLEGAGDSGAGGGVTMQELVRHVEQNRRVRVVDDRAIDAMFASLPPRPGGNGNGRRVEPGANGNGVRAAE